MEFCKHSGNCLYVFQQGIKEKDSIFKNGKPLMKLIIRGFRKKSFIRTVVIVATGRYHTVGGNEDFVGIKSYPTNEEWKELN